MLTLKLKKEQNYRFMPKLFSQLLATPKLEEFPLGQDSCFEV